MGNWNTSGGGSAGDFDDSYNEAMGFSTGPSTSDSSSDDADSMDSGVASVGGFGTNTGNIGVGSGAFGNASSNYAIDSSNVGQDSGYSYTSYEFSPVEPVSQPSIVDFMMPPSRRSKRQMSPVTSPKAPSIVDQLNALDRTTNLRGGFSVGSGFEKAPVYEVGPDNRLVMVKPPVYEGTTTAQSFYGTEDVNRARDILTATGSSYAGMISPTEYKDPGFFEELLGEKPEGYVLSPERVEGTGVEPSVITDDLGIVETGLSMLGGFASKLLLGTPDFASVKSLITGEKGSYSDISGGLIGALTSGPSVSFDTTTPDITGGDGSEYIPPELTPQIATAPKRRFRPILPPIYTSRSRFPSVSPPRAPQATRMFAAKGGYIPDTESFSKAVKERKKGYHMYAKGGQVYGVYPDAKNPLSYNVFGGTDTEVRQVFGDAFGYVPDSIDFSKRIGEPGFGVDATPGYMKMADGGVAGFVGDAPENVSAQETVADDVPVDVKEGTFVLNAPAVEFAGSKDIQRMLQEGIDILRERGIDISVGGGKIPEREAVGLLVSKGEVLVPPELAKVIGYDRLEKINNRGLKEVQRRQQGQEAPVDQQMRQVAATGGVQGLYNFSSVREIDTEADRLLVNMRNDMQNRVKEIDTSLSADEQFAQRSKITSQVLSKYHDQVRDLKDNSDPYAFQMFQDRNAEKNAALQNALEFGDYDTGREQRLADKATMSMNIPFGGEDDKLLGGADDFKNTGLVGFALPYMEGGDQVGYVAGKKTDTTSPSSTARHEAGHLLYKGRENMRLTPITVNGTTFAINEEQMMRLIDLDRTKKEGLEGEYERAMNRVTNHPRGKIRSSFASSFFRLNNSITREEIEENLPEIIEQIEKAQNF